MRSQTLYTWVLLFGSVLASNNKTSATAKVYPFSDESWTVKNEYGNITVPGSVPSQVHLDLFAAGVIGKSPQTESLETRADIVR